MEKKRWSLIFIGLCLALAFSVSPVEAQKDCDFDTDTYVKDTNKCRKLIDGENFLGIDCDDTTGEFTTECPDDGDTTTSKTSIDLIMTFDDREVGGVCADNICSDGDGRLVDNVDRVGVSAGGRSQPNPAAGIHMGLRAKPRPMRQLDLNIICEPIPPFLPGQAASINDCEQLPPLIDENDLPVIDGNGNPVHGFFGFFPECEGNQFCDLGVMVRPYKVNCPEKLPNGKCPDVFTMDPSTRNPDELKPVLMSFRLGFGGAAFLEVASAIGADGSQDPGRCLSLHSTPNALAEALCTTETGTHTSGVNSTDLVDTTRVEDFAELTITVGADIVKNVTDGSQGVITDISGSTITVDLEGGDDNVWEINDEYTIVRTSKCNVSVTAFDDGSDTDMSLAGDAVNDEWNVEAIGVTALICIPNTSTLLGKATLTFGFNAINKE